MAGRRTSAWIGGAAFVAVLVMAAGWFLLVSPARADASEVRQQTTAAAQQNDLLEMQLAALKADHEKLDTYRAELEALRVQVPRTLQDVALVRELEATAAATGVSIKDLTVMAPTTVVAVSPTPQTAPPAAAPAEGATDPAADPATDPAAQPVPTGPTAPSGMVGVDISITVAGNPDAVTAFLAAVQEGIARLVLVPGFDVTVMEDQGAQGGQAAVTAGDWQAVVRGTVYVLPTPPAGAAVPGAAAVPPAPAAEANS